MPSVGMRRTTRVFNVVNVVKDGGRVLRSGRRLWPESSDSSKVRRGGSGGGGGDGGDEWFKIIKSSPNNSAAAALSFKQTSSWSHGGDVKRVVAAPNVATDAAEAAGVAADCAIEKPKKRSRKAVKVEESVDKMFGVVYSRKRRRNSDNDKMYGIRFARRQRRKADDGSEEWVIPRPKLSVTVVGSGRDDNDDDDGFLARFLCTVLKYMRRTRLTLSQLLKFLCTEPITGVYASRGIRFSRDPPTSSVSGICKFFGTLEHIPMFSVDFSAVPRCFMYVYYGMFLRFECRNYVIVNKLINMDTDSNTMTDSEEDESEEQHHLIITSDRDVSEGVPPARDSLENKNIVHEVHNTQSRSILHPSVRASKLAGPTAQYRNGLNSRGIRKRRSSTRRRRIARNPLMVGLHKSAGALASDVINSRRNGSPFSSVVTNGKCRSSVRIASARQDKEVSSTTMGSTREIESSSCSANILVIESDRGYREAGVNVMLEVSSSREWVFVVKKDGLTRYTQKAEKIMKPSYSCNRFTNAVIWNLDNGWKLEFPIRQDWCIFKDLYKECSDRNGMAPTVRNIPVPGVLEVLDYGNRNDIPFCRPNSYISTEYDEVSRALARRTANYDMDSEDEIWLEKFNNESFTQNELHQHVSENNFELMVDAFEKANYCSPEDFPDEKAAANLCLDLARSEVVVAVYNYWMRKRKQKRSALVRCFQGHQPKRAPVIPKPILRKRRSLKRQPSQVGRGKQPYILQAMAAEQDALEEKNAMLKVDEANASANRSVEFAILKRKRAQFLMENADLATYRAMMAIRIAEAARVAESPDAASRFLD
ncbi:hypothetical protein ACB098_11G102100 [Castanea mollissima]